MAKAFGDIARKALRSAEGREASRGKMIGAVRAACNRQRIGDEDRRAIQREETGKASLADMSLAEIGKVLDRLNRGYKGPRGNRAYPGKIRALWWTLYWLGEADQPNDDAIDAFIARQTGKQRVQFLGHKEAFRVIEALKAWAARAGVEWPVESRVVELRPHAPEIDLASIERHAVLDAIAAKLRGFNLIGGYQGYCEKALGLHCNHWRWSARELDACIRLLGKKLRRALDKRGGE